MGVRSSRIVADHVLAACDRSQGDSISPSEMNNPEFRQALHSMLGGPMPPSVETVLSQYGFRSIERGKDLSAIKAAASNALPQLAEVVARDDEASSVLFSRLQVAISNWECHMQSMHQLACPKRPSDRIPVAKLCSLVASNPQLCAPHTTGTVQTTSDHVANVIAPMTSYPTSQNPQQTNELDNDGFVSQTNLLHDNAMQEQRELREWGGIPYMHDPVNYQ
ncbi:hypothetical protein CEP51_001647 [Fusarium floridanum]|uniref:Uncharacterized protein n=1 Tax=Fusarium floridanum TaxID=1325733 RepID=A0A428SFI2_9HYPO|nr:hypothetical protein CEP51_001647 [Fusarium floridanum]